MVSTCFIHQHRHSPVHHLYTEISDKKEHRYIDHDNNIGRGVGNVMIPNISIWDKHDRTFFEFWGKFGVMIVFWNFKAICYWQRSKDDEISICVVLTRLWLQAATGDIKAPDQYENNRLPAYLVLALDHCPLSYWSKYNSFWPPLCFQIYFIYPRFIWANSALIYCYWR